MKQTMLIRKMKHEQYWNYWNKQCSYEKWNMNKVEINETRTMLNGEWIKKNSEISKMNETWRRLKWTKLKRRITQLKKPWT